MPSVLFKHPKAEINYNEPIGEVKKTTCYMCACRCGINVYLRDEKVRYIEGNRDHPTNKGVLCAKGSAGIMQHYSPARLKKPLLRVGERGKPEFKEIEWDEALSIATDWLKTVRNDDPRKLAFFTGRDQSQSLTGWWAQQFGTINHAAHGGFCSVNMAAAGIYTIGGSFWEFGSPDWDKTKLCMIFGVAEDHDSNPIKLGIAKLKERGARLVSINPVRTGYSAVADQWVGIRPGTDGLLVSALIHQLLKKGTIDIDYLLRYTNSPWLVIDAPGTEEHGLFARDENDIPLVFDRSDNKVKPHNQKGIKPELGKVRVEISDGKFAVPSFALLAEHYLEEQYSPKNVASIVGIDETEIIDLAQEIAHVAFEEQIEINEPWVDHKGDKHDSFIGRPVSMHAMRGISAHSNGFHTCRLIHILQILIGSVDCPGGFRFKPPYPKAAAAHPKPGGKEYSGEPNKPIKGAPLGYPAGPEDLLVDADANPMRIDKAFSWEYPMSPHGMMHMVIANAHAGDPYPVDVLFLYMANMAWNSSMNTSGVIKILTEKDEKTGEYVIPKIIYSDAYASEMTAYADLIFPDTTYLERHDCISLLDRPICEPNAVADSIRWPVVEPDRDVRGFQSVLIELGGRLNLPGFVDDNAEPKYKDYADYIQNHERRPGVGPLIGWRGENGDQFGRGKANPDQLAKYIENGGFCHVDIPANAQYYKQSNQNYQKFAVEIGLVDAEHPFLFQLYLEPMQKFWLAASGFGEKQPPDHLRDRIKQYFTPIPKWYPPLSDALIDEDEFPYHALTQRPMAMYHSWGSQNTWLRQIHTWNPLYVPEKIAAELNLADDDWAFVTSHHGKIKVPVKVMLGVNERTVWTWNAIGKRKGAWGLDEDAPESNKGFLLNHLISELLPNSKERVSNSDPVTGQAAWFDLKVKIEKCDVENEAINGSAGSKLAESEPAFAALTMNFLNRDKIKLSNFGLQWKKGNK